MPVLFVQPNQSSLISWTNPLVFGSGATAMYQWPDFTNNVMRKKFGAPPTSEIDGTFYQESN